jgi:hypothetical protein
MSPKPRCIYCGEPIEEGDECADCAEMLDDAYDIREEVEAELDFATGAGKRDRLKDGWKMLHEGEDNG